MEDSIGEKTVYEKLWQCRNLEIEHYWHRMVFMTAFMLLCFAAYGGFFITCINKDCIITFPLFNLIGIVISLIGFFLSLLWVMMGKGSKAWYEEYENVIKAFVKDCPGACFSGLSYDTIKSKESMVLNNFLLNTQAGNYSVSKIGIALGHLSLSIWAGLILSHILLYTHCKTFGEAIEQISRFASWECISFVVCMALLFFWVYTKCCLQSGYFSKK